MQNLNKESWRELHKHYTEIQEKYNLMPCDIVRQLGSQSLCSYTQLLSPSGYDRTPSTREGSLGKQLRDLLTAGLTKTDWCPSTATYEDKLYDRYRNSSIAVHVLNSDVCDATIPPELSVSICMDECSMISKEDLTRMYTIDGIVPKIVEVSRSYQLVLREPSYVPFGDRPENGGNGKVFF